MRHGFLRSSRYSPGNMDRESLEALFVGRHEVMDDVLSRVTKSVASPEKHFILLVGPRGSGKTHFLAVAHHRLMERLDADKACDRVSVAVLNEEEWGVASYLDLLVRILRALANQAPELDAEIAGIFEQFPKDPAEAETLAVELLRRHTRGKTLLLLCENLEDLFQGLADEGQKRWRATIQEDGNWSIVASTPSLFSAVRLQDNPFYGFFTIRALEKIDFETGLELLARKAVHGGKSELAGLLRTPLGRARARAIHHLAAGNHRAYVVLFDFLDKESLEDLVGPFMGMVDDLTPYYQDRMRQLPPAQRKIVEFLCLEGKPTTIKDISTPCLMSHQTAAKQIGELESAGFVSKARSGRNTFCELSEPLMRICIEVKDNKTQHLRLFVEFLRHWFTTRELERRHAAFQDDDHAAQLDRVHVEEALRCALEESHEPFVDPLNVEAKTCWEAGDYSGAATIQQTLVEEAGRAEDYRRWVLALARAGDGQAAIAAGREAVEKFPDDGSLQYGLTHGYRRVGLFAEALSAIDRAIALDGKRSVYQCLRADVLLGLERFEEAIRDAEAVLDTDPGHSHSLEQIIEALVRLGRPENAEARVAELVQLAPGQKRALLTASNFFLSEDRLDEALKLVLEVLEIDSGDLLAQRMRGFVYFRMGDHRRASEDLREFALNHPQSISTHCWLADSLLYSDNFEEAIDVAKHLIKIDPDHSHAHYVCGSALMGLGQPADAVAAFDELLSTNDSRSLLFAASDLREIGDYASSSRYLDRVAELEPANQDLWIERTRLHIDGGAFDSAAESAAKIAALPGGSFLGLLFAAQVAAASKPLQEALAKIGPIVNPDDIARDEGLYLEVTAGTLTVSVRTFGPRYLPQGLETLTNLFTELLDEGVVGRVLTNFLTENIDIEFAGSLKDWETAFEGLASSLADLPDCNIPLEMLQAAVRYSKTGDERHLLSLPLEQRQLLEETLRTATADDGPGVHPSN